MTAKTITTYAEFWPYYLGEHRVKLTRALHFIGTSLAVVVLALTVWSANIWLLAAAIVQGYAWAWASHFFVEKNRPATFTYPGWSFISDWRMWALMLSGQLDAELAKYSVTSKSSARDVTSPTH